MTTTPEIYEYWTAPLSGLSTFHVYPDRAEHWTKGEETSRIVFSDIVSSRFVKSQGHGFDLRRVDLKDASGRLFRIMINVEQGTQKSQSADLAVFYDLLEDVLEKGGAKQVNPQITIGETPQVRWIIFIICVLSVLVAFLLLGFAIATRVSSQKLMNAAMPFSMMVIFGAYTGWMINPFQKRLQMSWDLFQKVVKEMDGSLV